MNRATGDTPSVRAGAESRIERLFEFLRGPAGPSSPPEVPGYADVRFLAAGGQASVYKARHVALNRAVALKVIPAGDPRAVSRLRAEAEMAAGLDHPNIVPLYEIGEHRGRHFIAMAFVEGETLAEWGGRGLRPAADAARVLVALAGAVEYAHGRGVIHRDIKPGNVLIGGDGVPRLTDFGLAKALEADGPASASGQVVGTPGYMPPEQALGRRDRVGPHSDVYSLGAVLHFLLTGRPPFQSASPLDTLKQVVHDEPVPPRRLNPSAPRDLETVCLKCLEKDPRRRYVSAGALADDLGRYLEGRPILARPASRPGRLWRWCRRNPVNAALAAALVAVAAAAFALVTWKWRAAVRSAELARCQERVADENYRKAREIVNRYLTTVSEDVLLNQPGMQPLRRKLLELALRYYREFLAQRAGDPEVRAEVAAAYFQVGRIVAEVGARREAARPYERAVALYDELRRRHPGEPAYRGELARSLNNLGLVKHSTGELGDAAALYTRGAAVARRLTAEEPRVAKYRSCLASCLTNLATLRKQTGDREAAAELFRRAIAERERLIAEGPATDRDRAGLAMAWANFGNLHALARRYDQAAAACGRAVAIRKGLCERNPAVGRYLALLADARANLGVIHCRRGEFKQALKLQEAAVGALEELSADNPAVDEYRRSLARVCGNLGMTSNALGDRAAAESWFGRAVSCWRRLADKNPTVPYYRRRLAAHVGRLAALRGGPSPEPKR